MKAGLVSLLQSPLIWRGGSVAATVAATPTGYPALDAVLPGGGWPLGALTEILPTQDGLGELSLLLPALLREARATPGTRVALVAPPFLPYAPALAQRGLDPRAVVVVAATRDSEAWWAAEQVLRCGQMGAVLFWPDRFDERGLRRLQAAAEQGGGLGVVFHAAEWGMHASPAPLRLRLEPPLARIEPPAARFPPRTVGLPSPLPGLGRVLVRVLKRRGSLLEAPVEIDLDADGANAAQPQPDNEVQGNAASPGVAGSAFERIAVTAISTSIPSTTTPARGPQAKALSFTKRYANGHTSAWRKLVGQRDTLRLSTAPKR